MSLIRWLNEEWFGPGSYLPRWAAYPMLASPIVPIIALISK